MNGLFGLELPTSVNFVIAFVVVLALIGAATWLVRRFGAPRLDAGARNRQPRLAVIDSAAVDGRRKLVIIRRDNVEHLLMVGGPTDVVVETNIVRSGAAVSREAPAVRVKRRDAAARHAAARHDALAVAARARGCRRAGAAGTGARGTRTAARPRSCPRARGSRATRRADQRRRRSITARGTGPRRTAGAARAPAPARRRSRRWCRSIRSAAAANDQNLANMAHQLEAALRRPVAAPAEAPKPIEQKRIEPVLRPVPKAARRRPLPVVAPQTTARAQHRARNGEPAGPSREKLTSTSLAACVRLTTAAAIALLAVPAHAQDISINFGQGAGLTERVIQ